MKATDCIYKGERLQPHEVAFNKLALYNLLNNAGCNNKPVNFKSVADAQKCASPVLKAIIEKLTPKEAASLLDRIQNIL